MDRKIYIGLSTFDSTKNKIKINYNIHHSNFIKGHFNI